jgi:hypothetical protein
MDVSILIGGIIVALILAALDSSVSMTRDISNINLSHGTDNHMPNHKTFKINFKEGHTSTAIRVAPDDSVDAILSALGVKTPAPCLFISGGAGGMSEEDIAKTRIIMDEGVAKFASEHGVTVIDGGTESGVMQMIGEARRNHHYSFPLIGVAPAGKVQYPGHANPDNEAELDSNHSHFVLVEADEWGGESKMIIDLTRAVCGKKKEHALGILINGGKIAQQDIYLATSTGDHNIPILVLEGSGRFAEELATAFRTGHANQQILKAIIAGGDIKLLATGEGVETMWEKLDTHFKKIQ